MSWPLGAPSTWTVHNDWRRVIQLWRAIGERETVLNPNGDVMGPRVFPPPSKVYYGGVVTAAGEEYIEDTAQTGDAHWPHAWHSYSPPIGSPDASDFDVIV